MKRLLRPLWRRGTRRLRYGYYVEGRGTRLVSALPSRVRRRLELDDGAAFEENRLEIGGGPYPTPGFVHVDVDPEAEHLEAYASAWALPIPGGWAQEIVAVHSLEHVEPPRLVPTLREWLRVLAPGGKVRIHVPNTPELMEAFASSEPRDKWRVMGAALGMFCGPTVSAPDELRVRSDHQLLFDRDLLHGVLTDAGFVEIRDRTEEISDRHTEAWKSVVPHFSLVFEAVKPAAA